MGGITAVPASGSRGSSHGRTRTKALLAICVQVVITVIFLGIARVFHGGAIVVVHVINVVLNAVIGIWLSVAILREWRRENTDPGDPRVFPWMLVLLIIAVAALTLDGADTFIYEMYSGNRSAETIVEGFNFSVQTVTTVGYGNWPLRSKALTATNDQFVELRAYSIFLMAMGASLFTVTMGMTTTWLMQLRL